MSHEQLPWGARGNIAGQREVLLGLHNRVDRVDRPAAFPGGG